MIREVQLGVRSNRHRDGVPLAVTCAVTVLAPPVTQAARTTRRGPGECGSAAGPLQPRAHFAHRALAIKSSSESLIKGASESFTVTYCMLQY